MPDGRAVQLRLRLGGGDRLARWSVQRQVGEEAFRYVFGHRLVVAA